MLRGLLIRQALLAVDILLAGVVLLLAYSAMQRVLSPPPAVEAGAGADARVVDTTELLRAPRPRSTYEPILEGRLFGDAGQFASDAPVDTPAAVMEPEVETTLPLALLGTVSSAPDDPLANAIIENQRDRTQQVHFIGDTVIDDVILAEVHPRRVVLSDAYGGNREVLWVDTASPSQRGGSPAAGMARRGGGSDRYGGSPVMSGDRATRSGGDDGLSRTFRRTELAQKLENLNYAEAYAKLSPHIARDEDGNVLGLTAKNINEFPLAREFGFQDGDVIQKINGVEIKNEQDAFRVVNRFQNSQRHWISILRDGNPQTLVFNLE